MTTASIAKELGVGQCASDRAAQRTLPPGVAYALAAGVIALGLFASVTPSPLYHVYATRWHFGPETLTLVFATYAFGVLTTLLVAGRVSDNVGRRPVLLVALAMLALSSVVFIAADSTAWLFVGRGIQGLATGAAISTAGAALLDLHPRRDPAAVGLANGVASATGLSLGILLPRRSCNSATHHARCPTCCSSPCSQSPSSVPTSCRSPSRNPAPSA